MLKAGVVGYGYWGPNIVRNFSAVRGMEVVSISDANPESLKRAASAWPGIKTVQDFREITASSEIDVVAVVTPVDTHYEIAKDALENGKHVFIEKPFTSSVAKAEELIELAARKRLKIMVDHTFLFTGVVRKIKKLVDEGLLGDLYYYDSTRVNLGLFQHDVNVIWDLAPHDFSIMDYVLGKKPVALTANGVDHFGRDLENIAYVTLYFEDNLIAHFNVNWLSPVKVRKTLIGGEKKMLVWDDLEADEKIKIYDKGVIIGDKKEDYATPADYRSGDMWAPRVDHTEALKVETEYFIDCITSDVTPHNDGEAGLRVVKLLEATGKSIKEKGRWVEL